ncbi:ROK family transcriptional regulator [Tabrizicola sp.]|uniref:ROK family transcriptional regulator n=1 Tax=Tabrizicola sp. TaxID=2005166 RepID=UPI003F3C3AEB
MRPPSPLAKSERELLAILLREGRIPRASVTERVRLSQQSVHRLLDSLERRGFVRFGEAEIRGRGKPSPMVGLSPDRYASIGLSVTTESVFLCLLNITGQPLALERLEVAPNDPEEVLKSVEHRIASWKADELKSRDLIGIGVAMQGYRTGTADRFEPPLPLAAWRGLPLEAVLADRFGLPVVPENNATASAIAEAFLGAGGAYRSLVYLSFNYGFGAGLFVNGHPVVGDQGNAGEISLLFATEENAHRPALGELLKRVRGHGIALQTVSELCASFDPGWPGVADWIAETGPRLRLALRAIKAILDPAAIFFGGEAPARLRQLLIAEAQTAFADHPTPNPRLCESAITGDAAHLGAAFLPLRTQLF